MLFQSYVPRAPLCDFIADFWLYENYEGKHQRELILPSGTFEMVFNLQEDELRIYSAADPQQCRRFAGAVVSGPYSGSFMSDAAEERAILGVHFKPGGAVAFLGFPGGDFRDTHVDLRAVWGPFASMLRDQLCALREPTQRFRLLEQVFLRRLGAYLGGHGAVRIALDLLMSTHGQAKTRDIAAAVGLSQRRVIGLFEGEVGLTPKLFARIRRFQHAVSHIRGTMHVDSAQLAIDCGYFDQSHLIRDFGAFTGVTPADYRRRQDRLQRASIHTKRHHLPLTEAVQSFPIRAAR